MEVLSQDVDLVRYEPELFGDDLYMSSQVLCTGTDGVISGTSFTSASADFVGRGVKTGQVIYLQSGGGTVNGPFEVVAVVSATELTVSVPRGASETAIPPVANASYVAYRVCTYEPQAVEMALLLTERFGLRPGRADAEYGVEDLVDTESLRRASALGMLAGLYARLGNRATDGEALWKKSLYYRRLFEQALERCRAAVDAGDDGIADRVTVGGVRRLRRE